MTSSANHPQSPLPDVMSPLMGCCFHLSAPRCLLFCLCSLYTINPLIRNQKPGCPWTELPPSLTFFNLKHHYPHPQTTLSGPLETGTGCVSQLHMRCSICTYGPCDQVGSYSKRIQMAGFYISNTVPALGSQQIPSRRMPSYYIIECHAWLQIGPS